MRRDEKSMKVLRVIKSKAREVGYGELNVKFIIHGGELTGFDVTDPTIFKYRVRNDNT